MNITASRAWSDVQGQTTFSDAPKDQDRGAFQQALRVMEKNLWNGLESASPAGKKPVTTGAARPNPARGQAHAIPGTASSMVSPPGANAPSVMPAGRERVLTASEGQPAPARAIVANGPVQREAAGAEGEYLAPYAQVARALTAGSDASRSPSGSANPPPQSAGSSTPAKPADTANAIPYRLNVSVDAGAVSIVMRIDGASSREIETLKQKALAEARRHGTHNVRLVINGIAQTSNLLPGTPYGY
jgi:hypothetical protein